ncbi:MAG: toxin-antitoxin system HicB family antitoxin [Bacilli bacterium]|jgi:predicted HicB family RNase H-like nuclease|nr:toxin-antitoxin system HicB family antitoxin [Bacilli bacterium]
MEKTKQLIIRVSPEVKKELKLYAVENDKSMNDIVLSFLIDGLRKAGKNV